MIHATTVALAGSVTILTSALLFIRWCRSPSRAQVLSEAVRDLVNQSSVEPLKPHLTRAITVPFRDGLSLYSNSRLLVAECHRLWLNSSQSIEDEALYELAVETHEEMKRNFGWYLVERMTSIVLTRRTPVYSLLLAESFSEMVEAVNQFAQRSSDERTLALVESLA